MAQNTPLYIVASQHPRVGKTLVSRLLIEFFRFGGRPVVGYDLDPHEPTLAGYFPSFVWPVDIAETRGQMALFDRLIADDWRTTVLDIGYGQSEQFFKVMPEIGFEQEAARRGIVPIILFITDWRRRPPAAMPNCADACRGRCSCPCTMKRRPSCSSPRTFHRRGRNAA